MRLFTVAALAGALGCAHEAVLVPAPQLPRGPDGSAQAAAAGVEFSVDGRLWSGSPHDLASLVAPLYVAIHNTSQVPVRLRYRDFTLIGQTGLQTAAIPPFQIQRPGSSASMPLSPGFAANGFLLYGPYGDFYPGMPLWGGPWDYDPWFYDSAYQTWEPSLPTRDMLQQALPEGVLQPGGAAAGYLYFHRLKDQGPVTFSAEIVEATSRKPLGDVQVPMVLQ